MVGNGILLNWDFCHGYRRLASFEIELYWLGSNLALNKWSVKGFGSHAHPEAGMDSTDLSAHEPLVLFGFQVYHKFLLMAKEC